MNQVLTEPLFYIDLIYGISFLLMSFVVFEGTRRASSTIFVTTFYMLGGFGLVHGITLKSEAWMLPERPQKLKSLPQIWAGSKGIEWALTI